MANTCLDCDVPRKHRSLAQRAASGAAREIERGGAVGGSARSRGRPTPHSDEQAILPDAGKGEQVEQFETLRSDSMSRITGTSWSAAQRNTGGLLQWAYDEMGIEEPEHSGSGQPLNRKEQCRALT